MKRLTAIMLLILFMASFAAGYLMTAQEAQAACVKSCYIIRCIPEKVCVCDGVPKCCHCIWRD